MNVYNVPLYACNATVNAYNVTANAFNDAGFIPEWHAFPTTGNFFIETGSAGSLAVQGPA
jgi:hypothetical protein